ncbi:MAG: hypothetical protein H6Q90_1170 [Deltaproteobacteria bacterium]|nr:hypothetical protein [Deltaproteobacteria bacterium]
MRRALAVLALASCAGQTGTVTLELTTAPGSTLLDGVQHLRVTVTDPHTVVESDRTESGFDLALEIDATGAAGALVVEGFDSGGSLIAAGSSPPFPVAAISARIVVYMAQPLTIGSSPARLPASRTGVASAPLTFGLVLAGGQDAAGAKTDAIFIYNAYDHSLLGGLPMPAPRAFQTLAVGSNNAVSIFGGVDATDIPSGSLWRFDTTAPPSGSYNVLPEQPALARQASSAIQLGPERFVITGTPPIDLALTTLTPRTDLASLPPNGAAVSVAGQRIGLFADHPIHRLQGDSFDELAVSVEPTATVTALSDGRVAFVGPDTPASRDVLVVLVADGTAARIPGVLSTERQRAAAAASTRYLVVAGGADLLGAPIANADVLDATTLARIATIPCFPRTGATAYLLPNDQIAIVGGEPANDVIELFTPPPIDLP